MPSLGFKCQAWQIIGVAAAAMPSIRNVTRVNSTPGERAFLTLLFRVQKDSQQA